jgi:hypothetical protein
MPVGSGKEPPKKDSGPGDGGETSESCKGGISGGGGGKTSSPAKK